MYLSPPPRQVMQPAALSTYGPGFTGVPGQVRPPGLPVSASRRRHTEIRLADHRRPFACVNAATAGHVIGVTPCMAQCAVRTAWRVQPPIARVNTAIGIFLRNQGLPRPA